MPRVAYTGCKHILKMDSHSDNSMHLQLSSWEFTHEQVGMKDMGCLKDL